MKINAIIFVFVLFSAFAGFAQNSNYLFYRLIGAKEPYAVLFSHKGDLTKPVDTAYLQQSGGYAFVNIDRFPVGVYTVMFNDSTFTEVILNNENIVMEADVRNILMTINVRSSIENSILFSYWKFAIAIKDSINILNLTLQSALESASSGYNPQLDSLDKKIDELNHRLFSSVEKSLELYPEALAPKLIYAYQLPDYQRYLADSRNQPYPDEMEFYRHHFFDYIDFSDERFLNTKVFYVSISDYIKNFGNPASTAGYIAIIDKVMGLAKADSSVFEYCLNLFIRNFDNTIWEDVFVYIIDRYYRDFPHNNKSVASYYITKAEAIKRLKPGREAPNFQLNDTAGNLVSMHDIKAKAKMLVFYASDCPHCEEAIPRLIEIYHEYKSLGFEIVGVALDDDPEQWKKSLINQNIPWISLSDMKGMSSPVVDAYNIWSTPTMIILNSKNVIMKKPTGENEIHSTLLQLLYK